MATKTQIVTAVCSAIVATQLGNVAVVTGLVSTTFIPKTVCRTILIFAYDFTETSFAYSNKGGRKKNHHQKRDLLHDGAVSNSHSSIFNVNAAENLEVMLAGILQRDLPRESKVY
jgi:hypothetical protein